ncbi:MAG: hypothetical protein Q4G58_14650 [bacterium]|nr:hypothetical protein [bacterium]
MKLFKSIDAVWEDGATPYNTTKLTITVDLSSIQAQLKIFDLYLITLLTVEVRDTAAQTSQTFQYEYTNIMRNIEGNTAAFTVTILGNKKDYEQMVCTTEGYYLCKEEKRN